MNLQIIAAPIIGGLIGLLTNGIAIRMLFRPHHEIRIGRFTVPFTPGLIPKERGRIAAAIGKIVGNELLNSDTLSAALCSESMKAAYSEKYVRMVDEMRHDGRTVESYLEERGLRSPVALASSSIAKQAGSFITNKLIEQNVSGAIVDYAAEQILQNLNPMLMAFAGGAIEAAKMSISIQIDNLILEKGPGLIEDCVASSLQDLMQKPIYEAVEAIESKFPDLKQQIWAAYQSLIEKHASDFIQQLHISNVLEEKINALDVADLEHMIMEIARKELRSLVWLGGFLGMVMGFLNLLF